jgi:hypothetical protein
MASREVHRR